jgi:hypothetical protein
VTSLHSDGCALLIGIDDYRAFDPSGDSDLKGGAHDTVAAARCCTVLGMNPVDIHILRDDVESAGNPFTIRSKGKTTRAAIEAQLGWLREQLDAGRKGLLWYSGHGAHTEKDGLLLCPSDTDATFAGAISFKGLKALLGPNAAQNLTVVLDCCHGGPRVDRLGRRSSTLGGDPIEAGAAFDDDLQIGAIVLAACAPGEQTQQSWFSALPHGAFTWALLSTANQWQAQQQGANVRMDLDYATLMAKAGELLRVLEFEGNPQLHGPPGVDVGKLAALQIGNDPEATSPDPDADRGGVELDPDMHYALGFSHSDATAVIDTSPISGTSTTSCFSTEYWSLNAAFLTAAAAGTASGTLTLTAASARPDLPVLPGSFGGFALPTNAAWKQSGSGPSGNVWYASRDSSVIVLDFSDLRAPAAGAIWSGTLAWHVASTTSPDAHIFGTNVGDTLQLSYGSVPSSILPAGATWYKMVLSPLTWSPTTALVPRGTTIPAQSPTSLAVQNTTLYMTCYVPGVTTILFSSSDGVRWAQSTVNADAQGTALAALGTSLFGAYVGAREGAIVICDMLNPGVSYLDTGIQGTLPALAGVGSTLYMVTAPASGGPPSFTAWSAGTTIHASGAATSIGTAPASAPTLAVFNGKLYLAVLASPGPNLAVVQVWYYNPADRKPAWKPSTGDLSTLPVSGRSPQLAVFNGRLFLTVTDGASSHVWLCSTGSDDATGWSGFQDLTLQLPGLLDAGSGTRLSALGSSLVLAYGDGTDACVVQTLVT